MATERVQGAEFTQDLPEDNDDDRAVFRTKGATTRPSFASDHLYELLDRRPSAWPFLIAAGLTLAWLAAVAAFAAARPSLVAWPPEDPLMLSALAGFTLIPVLVVWAGCYLVWRAERMHLLSEALARAAIRLAEPENMAGEGVATVASAVRREVATLQAAVGRTHDQVAELGTSLGAQLRDIETGTARAESRAQVLSSSLGDHQERLKELGATLGKDADHIGRWLREQLEEMHSLASRIEQDFSGVSDGIASRVGELSYVAEDGSAKLGAATEQLDKRLADLASLTSDAIGRNEKLATQYDQQHKDLSSAADRLEKERGRLETVVRDQHKQLSEVENVLGSHVTRMEKLMNELAGQMEGALDIAGDRAHGLGREFADQISLVVNTAESAKEEIAKLSEEASRSVTDTASTFQSVASRLHVSAGEAAERAREEIDGHLNGVRDQVTAVQSETDAVSKRLVEILMSLGATVSETNTALNSAFDTFDQRFADLPQQGSKAFEALHQVLNEHLEALSVVTGQVAAHAKEIDLHAPDVREDRLPEEPLPAAPRERVSLTGGPDRDRAGKWNLPELLSTVDASYGGGWHHARELIESLQALSINISDALDMSDSPDLWRRYRAGERNVFGRHLYSKAGQETYQQIERAYESNPDFRNDVDLYVADFEDLLDMLADKDKRGVLIDTLLTADLGRVYLVLAQASGRLS